MDLGMHRPLSPRCRRLRAGLAAMDSAPNRPNTASGQKRAIDQVDTACVPDTDEPKVSIETHRIQHLIDSSALQNIRDVQQSCPQSLLTVHSPSDESVSTSKSNESAHSLDKKLPYVRTVLHIAHQFFDALYHFVEASWSYPDELDESEQADVCADVFEKRDSDQLDQDVKSHQWHIGPGAVASYDDMHGVCVTQSSTTSFRLLWFSLLHQLSLLLVGLAAWWITGSRPWIGNSTYLLVGLGLWCTHWFGHRRWFWRAWFNEHTMGHHVKAYPPSKFLSERYVSVTQRAAGKPQKPTTGLGLEMSINTIVYLPWPVIATLLHCQATSNCTVTEAGLVLVIGLAICLEQEMIHRAVHTRGCWLERYQWFQTMRALHFLHHKDDMQHNYAMIDFCLDIISGNLINSV